MLNFDFNTYNSKSVSGFDKKKSVIKMGLTKEKLKNGKLAFFNDISEFIGKEDLEQILNLSEYIKNNCDVFIVIGTGGSSLGSQAIIEALSTRYVEKKPEIIYTGDDLSAINMKELIEYIKDKEVIINLISKSGTTMEPLLAYNTIKYVLEAKYTEDEMKTRVILTTDKETGGLNKLALEKGYQCLGIPNKVGGRFSVMTVAGLLPIAVAGIDIISLVEGYVDGLGYFDRAIEYAQIRDILYNKGKAVESFTLYESRLSKFGDWLKQLFAETQGKDKKGILPITCVNTKDLHSMGQFLQDGNPIVFETMIGVADTTVIKTSYNAELNEINKIALFQTAKAHSLSNTPSNIIIMEKLDEYNLGNLVYFFMIASIAGALILNVNPLDQPGVEKYKELIKKELAS